MSESFRVGNRPWNDRSKSSLIARRIWSWTAERRRGNESSIHFRFRTRDGASKIRTIGGTERHGPFEPCWIAAISIVRRIVALALSGQMHGATLLDDRTVAVLRPCILWNDQRSAPQCTGHSRIVSGFRNF